jgi:hypothetical protein
MLQIFGRDAAAGNQDIYIFKIVKSRESVERSVASLAIVRN